MPQFLQTVRDQVEKRTKAARDLRSKASEATKQSEALLRQLTAALKPDDIKSDVSGNNQSQGPSHGSYSTNNPEYQPPQFPGDGGRPQQQPYTTGGYPYSNYSQTQDAYGQQPQGPQSTYRPPSTPDPYQHSLPSHAGYGSSGYQPPNQPAYSAQQSVWSGNAPPLTQGGSYNNYQQPYQPSGSGTAAPSNYGQGQQPSAVNTAQSSVQQPTSQQSGYPGYQYSSS